MRKFKIAGFTLVEVIFAISLIILGTGSIFALMQKSNALALLAERELEAIYLAQEGAEIVRNIRDGNWLEQRANPGIAWDDGLDNCATGCEADYNDAALVPYAARFLKIDGSFYNYDSGSPTAYKRKIIITKPELTKLSVSVEVSRTGMPTITLRTELYDWR